MCLYSSVFYMCVHWGWWERILTCCLSFNAPLYLECFTGLHFMYACRFILGRDGWRVGSLSLWWPEMAQQYWVSVISIIFRLLSPPAPLRLSHPTPPSSSLCPLLPPPPLFVPSSSLFLVSPPPHFIPSSPLSPPPLPSSSSSSSLSFLHFPSNFHTPRSTCSAATRVLSR